MHKKIPLESTDLILWKKKKNITVNIINLKMSIEKEIKVVGRIAYLVIIKKNNILYLNILDHCF